MPAAYNFLFRFDVCFLATINTQASNPEDFVNLRGALPLVMCQLHLLTLQLSSLYVSAKCLPNDLAVSSNILTPFND